MRKHFEIIVTGKVQGVFYRANTAEKAKELGLKGAVKNLANGDVHIEAEGEEEVLNQLVEWCRLGPSRAIVREVKFGERPLKNFSDFKVIR